MCDTIYAATPAGGVWFGKNSDRHPDEPQALKLLPAHAPEPTTRVGAVEFARPDRGLAMALSKPSWMAGGEMGLNAAGVAIGNEAVFAKEAADKDGPLGMDILRAALSASASAAEARDFLCAFIEAHGQGGNGAYRGSLVYSNSFIVADGAEAYVVETAGRRWAWRAAEGVATISNAYSIEDDFKRLDALTRKQIAPVNERMACVDEEEAGRVGAKGSWRAWVESRFHLRFTRGDDRAACTAASLRSNLARLGLGAMIEALRSHGDGKPGAAGMKAPCVHEAGFPVRASTTASMVASWRPGGATLWFSGTSYPCLSIYAPILLAEGRFEPLWTGYDYAAGSDGAYAFWKQRRDLQSKLGGARRSAEPAFVARRDGIQSRLEAVAARAAAAPSDTATLAAARAEVDAAMGEWAGFLASTP